MKEDLFHKDKKYCIGIEREGLRCDNAGILSKKPHPAVFGDRMKNPLITTDFGEAMIELKTAPCYDVDTCYDKLRNTTNTVLSDLDKQHDLLWPYSMPCTLPAESDFIFNNYENYPLEAEYEKQLYEKYGYQMHCISGIHVNLSIPDEFYQKLKGEFSYLPNNVCEAYIKIINRFLSLSHTLRYIYGASPISINNQNKDEYSVRSSKGGFGNKPKISLDYSSKQAYINSAQKLLEHGDILRLGENYSFARLNFFNHYSDFETSSTDYVEIRLCDINPFDICGISKEYIAFTVALFFYLLIENDIEIFSEASNGKANMLQIIDDCAKIDKLLNLDFEDELGLIKTQIINGQTNAEKLKTMGADSLKNALLEKANDYNHEALTYSYSMWSHPEVMNSTAVLIKDAIECGVDYRIIDDTNSIIEFSRKKRKEIVVQTSMTNTDSYIFPYITDDKIYAKEQLKKAGICVPESYVFSEEKYKKQQEKILEFFSGYDIAIKPKSSNYGDGISILINAKKDDIDKAVTFAFKYDKTVFIEEYAVGKEYRFFVVDGVCKSVVNRRNAQVEGDGVHSISELMKIKEQTPRWLYCNKKFEINQLLYDCIEKYGYTLDSILQKDEIVTLHEVSNASCGGEAVDVFDEIDESYKLIAEKSAKVFNCKICGADLIIPDIHKKNGTYSMLEINDNPGLLISEVPNVGKHRKLGVDILKLIRILDK